MLKAFGDLSKQIKLGKKLAVIDNNVFRLHYRMTFMLFLGATVLVSSRQYIGEHIRCIADKGVPTHVIETYCFFTTTFTVIRHLNETLVKEGHVPHPGIGPVNSEDPIIIHAYYQWVPFMLFFQALMFYLPHFIWKNIEGGRVLSLVKGFENSAMALMETAVKLKNTTVPSRGDYEAKLALVRQAFLDRLHINKFWAGSLVTCELINGMNLVAQIYLTDVFLGGAFLTLGQRVFRDYHEDVDTLDLVFPKMTKCTFWKYGPSGSIQQHDALCVMALNIVNEKIYTFLWFWLVMLLVLTAGGLFWRFLTLILHSRSQAFNKYVFRTVLDRHSLNVLTTRCDFSDWLFLYYIGKSMNSYVFRELVKGLAFEMEEEKLGLTEGETARKLL